MGRADFVKYLTRSARAVRRFAQKKGKKFVNLCAF